MKTDTKHQDLRELLIREILESIYIKNPSKTSLMKMKDWELVGTLKYCSIQAERQLWRGDIIKVLQELNPKKKFNNISNLRLIPELIEVASNTKK